MYFQDALCGNIHVHVHFRKVTMIYKNCIILLMGFAGSGKLTTAKELIKYLNFKLVDNHTWNNPIFNLINQDGMMPLPKTVWIKTRKICDVVFETMKELSPHDFSFVLTAEMIEGEDFAKSFYNQVCQLAIDRKALLLPVRLECEEVELTKRIREPNRRALFKTIDEQRASRLVQNHKVFYSKHPNEITIDDTKISAKEVARMIIDFLEKRISTQLDTA